MRRRRLGLRICAGLVVMVLVVLAAAVVSARALVGASLARETGEAEVPGLLVPVAVERDALGAVRIVAPDMAHAAAALGFVHGQERFFQMDLLRRVASGRLSELLGRATVETDIRARGYGFERCADGVLASMPERHRVLLEAYARGVNAGLSDLGARPPEYLLLRSEPAPWSARDCVLVQHAMFMMLSFGAGSERMIGVMEEVLGPEAAAFYAPDVSRFDAPVVRDDGAPALAPMPGPGLFADSDGEARVPAGGEGPVVGGSNNWAVSGRRTRDGRAIVANDMHLGLRVPNIWFRAELRWGERRAVGVTLPGFPGVVAGSTDRVAWGFTNVMADTQDLVIVEEADASGRTYRTSEGPEPFVERTEVFQVRGGRSLQHTYRETRWGAVLRDEWMGREVVLRWPAMDAERVNVALLDVMEAEGVEDALAIGAGWFGPPQNMVVADSAGRIGWTLTGWIPRRLGFDGTHPVSWADPEVRWIGNLAGAARPRVVDPEDGVIVTANNRTMPADVSRGIGRGWASGVRARRIGELLGGREMHDEASCVEIQLDLDVGTLVAARHVVLRYAEEEPLLFDAEALEVIRSWDGRATVESRAVFVLDSFMSIARDEAVSPMVRACRDADEGFGYWWFNDEEVLLRLLEERPAHLLGRPHARWVDLVSSSFRRAADLSRHGDGGALVAWGEVNRSAIRHPLSGALGVLSRLVDVESRGLAGHGSAVRVVTPTFGASERFAVSPSAVEEGLFQMPCGQSGHVLSRHLGDMQAGWESGESVGLVPGEAKREMMLVPARVKGGG